MKIIHGMTSAEVAAAFHPACEVCGATTQPISVAYHPSGKAPVYAHMADLPDGGIVWACYCDAHGGQERALDDLDRAGTQS